MLIFIQLFVLSLGILMFKLKLEYKIAIFFFSVICLDAAIIRFIPFGGAKFFLSMCFIGSELPRIKRRIKLLKMKKVFPLVLMMILATFVLAFNSTHYQSFVQILRLIIVELLAKYFVICYAFIAISSPRQFKPSFRAAYVALLILTVFGIINLITKYAIWIDINYQGIEGGTLGDLGRKFVEADRFRVQAMFQNPFNYGYICILMSLFFLYGYLNKIILKKQFYIAQFCCLFGIVLCGCRTVVLCYIVGLLLFVCNAFSLKKWLGKALVVLIVIFLSLPFIINIDKYTSLFVKAFDTSTIAYGNEVGGSSIGMRIVQFTAVLYHIKDHLLFGRGKDFFSIDLGFGEEGIKTLIDKDLLGLESVLMNLLLERGIVGVLFWCVFYGTLLFWAFKLRRYDKYAYSLYFSLLIVYLTFSNMTGELNSVFPTLLLIGGCLRILKEKSMTYEV